MIEINEIQCFVECADARSFTKAAEQLYTSQSNVSKKIKALEETVGKKLFLRQRKGIFLTEEGKQIYAYARNIIENIKIIQNFGESGSKKGYVWDPDEEDGIDR